MQNKEIAGFILASFDEITFYSDDSILLGVLKLNEYPFFFSFFFFFNHLFG